MTISDKIRIYELSRDLNLENKDILDAAQKLSISVKSHSSSISTEDAKKIKNQLTKKTKVIIPVHLYGQTCDMDEIFKTICGQICNRYIWYSSCSYKSK